MAKEKRKRLFLVDGHALAYRAFYAMVGRPLRNSKGENTSVPWGIIRFILKLVREHQPDYLTFVFDSGVETFRHEIYEPYKATREKLDEEEAEEFQTAMQRVAEILETLRIPAIQVENYEADDVIGTLAKQAAEKGLEAVIVSGDRDFYQLIGSDTSVVEPGRGGRAAVEAQWIDAKAAAKRLGVPPEKVIDYRALVGDASDNIPGVRGIGPKTAAALLEQFGTLEEVLENLDRIDSKRTRKALEEQREEALLSKDLVTIRTDAPVRIDLRSLKVQEPDERRLRELLLDLEFHTLLPEFAPQRTEESSYEVVAGPEVIARLAKAIQKQKGMALEAVGDGKGPRGGPPVGIAIAVEPGRACYLPLRHAGEGNLPDLRSTPMSPLAELIASPEIEKTGHDLKRAYLALRAAGVEMSGYLRDTMLASYCLDPSQRQHDLEIQVIERFGNRLQSDREVRPEGRSFTETAPDQVAVYAGERADLALSLAEQLFGEMEQYGLERLYDEIEMPLLPVLADMEWTGIRVDMAVLGDLSRDFSERLTDLRARIYALAGQEFNIDSVAQLRDVLFKRLQLPVKRRTKTGPSTDADVLAALAAEGHELPARMIEYRELAKLKSTYVDALRDLVSPETHRLHTSFNQAVAATGRLSSSEPNLQNIPIRTPLGASIRRAFIPADGYRMMVADYSQIDLRVLAHMSGAQAFVEAFRSQRDIHRDTAARIFHVPLAEVTSEMRSTAKTVNYATTYGQGPRALAQMLGIDEEAAARFIEEYFERFPTIRAYLESRVEQAEREGFVETIFGRRRYVPELRSRIPGTRGAGRRIALNTPIQGSAADIIKLAMIHIHHRILREGHRSRMLLQVHDELVFEVHEDEIEPMKALVLEEMEGVVELEVPLATEIGVGTSWYDAKP